jgi:hypothetical protein
MNANDKSRPESTPDWGFQRRRGTAYLFIGKMICSGE